MAAVAVVATLALSGCSSASGDSGDSGDSAVAAAQTPDEAFDAAFEVGYEKEGLPGSMSGASVESDGQLACKSFEAGMTVPQMYAEFSSGWPVLQNDGAKVFARIIFAATPPGSYCEQYHDQAFPNG